MHIRLRFVQNQPALFQAIFHISLQLFERSNRTVGINGIYHKLLVRNIHARNTLLGKQVIYLPAEENKALSDRLPTNMQQLHQQTLPC